tara:strand:- start:723 stop:1496 length:774 start_codon:yes stop_codon:yes gene_type:complete
MKYISWNVNGIRACIKKGFIDFINNENPDLICIQETKANQEQVELNLPEYTQYWNSAEKPGYSGTLILTKHKPINCYNGLGIDKHDNEGRVITLEFNNHYIINVYTPNSKRDLSRLDYRSNEWDKDFLFYVNELEKEKPVIFCGDLNVAHKEIDLANPQNNKTTKSRPGNAGFTDAERLGFDNIVESGFIDTFRLFNNDADHYTWWSYMFNSRKRNIGWRIDYFCISSTLKKNIDNAYILPDIMGSDHCPIGINITI